MAKAHLTTNTTGIKTTNTYQQFLSHLPITILRLVVAMLVIPTAFILFVSIAHTTTYAVYLFDTILLNIVLPSVVIICVMLVPVLRHPVHALLALLGAFVTMAGIFLSVGAEYIALVFMVVFVGALAILFLFVVMLL